MGRALNVITIGLIVLWAIQEYVRFFGGSGNGCTLGFALALTACALVWGMITYLYWHEDDF